MNGRRVYLVDTSDGRTLRVIARDACAALLAGEAESGFYCRNARRPRRVHRECKPGAAVRLHGYAPARVARVYVDADGRTRADCVITARGPDWKAGRIGPHGYRPGERVDVRACEAVPRDIIRISRQSPGRIIWGAFNVQTGPDGDA